MSKGGTVYVESRGNPGCIEDPFLKLRVMVIDAEFYKSLTDKLYSSFQSGASVILYEMGLGYGELMGQRMKEMGTSRLQIVKDFIELGKTHGYGEFNTPFIKMVVSGIRGEPLVRLENSFFASAIGRTGKTECYLIAGIIAGATQVLFNKKYTCIEEKCLSRGDAYCEFRVKPTPSEIPNRNGEFDSDR